MPNSSQPKSWRDVLPIHPAAELLPVMSETELRELGEDIKKNGLRTSIVLHGNELIDGRNRLDAMELVGIKFKAAPVTEKVSCLIACDGSDVFDCRDFFNGIAGLIHQLEGDPYDFVLSANLHRRHLTGEQKRALIAKLLKAKPEASDRQVAKQTKTSPTTVGKIRKQSEAAGDVSKLDTRTDTQGRKQPAKKTKPKVDAEVTFGTPCTRRVRVRAVESSPDCDTAQQRWEFSLRNLAGDAISLSAFWSREFGNWKRFNVASDLVTLAQQAADAWKQLARELKDKAPHYDDNLSIPESLRQVPS
jgi:hypothetical protein